MSNKKLQNPDYVKALKDFDEKHAQPKSLGRSELRKWKYIIAQCKRSIKV